MMQVCSSCIDNFFYDPSKMAIVLVSFIVSLAALLFLVSKKERYSKRIGLVYVHLFFLIFPFLFYIFATGCEMFFSSCNATKSVLTIIALVIITTIIATSIIAPILFFLKFSGKSYKVTEGWMYAFIIRNSIGIKPPNLYVIDSGKPLAFALSKFRNSIFISVGLIEILTEKELEAVMLHEMAHINQDSSIVKYSTSLLRLFSPFAAFMSFDDKLDEEERKADGFASKMQGTCKHISSAKKKLKKYHSFSLDPQL